MTSRLDRLYLLIENGSNIGIRKAAAVQLGDVAKYYPREIGQLLKKISELLGNKNWDTRIAAGDSVSAVVQNIPQHELQYTKDAGIKDASEDSDNKNKKLIEYCLSDFDLNEMLDSGARLYSSDEILMIEGEREVNQTSSRKEVLKQLGCGDYVARETDQHTGVLKDVVAESDLILHPVASEFPSSRRSVERAMQCVLKRRNQKLEEIVTSTKSSNDNKLDNEDGLLQPPPTKRLCSWSVDNLHGHISSNSDLNSPDSKPTDICSHLHLFLQSLLARLWDPAWEIRHGAATGLRELLRSDTISSLYGPSSLENIAVRVLCTLSLDQVSDFISDDVVAPVRETCAQVLGVLCLHLNNDRILLLARLLLNLSSRYNQWMVAQGGLLGIKYVLAATRERLCGEILPLVYRDVFHHLVYSHDEDVLGWSASTLEPVTKSLPSVLPNQDIVELVNSVWSLLSKLVNSQEGLLSSYAINSLMALLCSLYSSTDIRKVLREQTCRSDNIIKQEETATTSPALDLEGCLAMLIPYLYHDMKSVQHSAVRTISILLYEELRNIQENENPQSQLLSPSLLNAVIEQLFLCTLLHNSPELFEEIEKVWLSLLAAIQPEYVARACLWRIDVWLVLVMQPNHVAYSKDGYLNLPRKLIPPVPVNSSNDGTNCPATSEKVENSLYYLGGSQIQLEGSMEEREEKILCVRMQAAKLLGWLCNHMARTDLLDVTPNGQQASHYLLDTLFLLHLNGKLGLPRMVVSLVFYYWTSINGDDENATSRSSCNKFRQRVEACLSEAIYYEEILPNFRRMQKLCRDLIVSLSKIQGINMDSFTQPGQVLNLSMAEQLVGPFYTSIPSEKREFCSQEWSRAHSVVTATATLQSQFQMRIQSVLACSLIRWSWLPSRLSPLIRPLMECLKREASLALQELSGCALARLLAIVSVGIPGFGSNPSPKVIKNLVSYFMSFCPWNDPSITTNDNGLSNMIILSKILSEANGDSLENSRILDVFHGNTSIGLEGLQQRGSCLAFKYICQEFSDDLPVKFSCLWQLLLPQTKDLLVSLDSMKDNTDQLLTSLRVLEVCFTFISSKLQTEIFTIIPLFFRALSHSDPRLRYQSASVIATMASVRISECLNVIIEKLLPSFKPTSDEFQRMGIIETIHMIVHRLEMKILPYLILLLTPCLEMMTDHNALVRYMASQIFSSLMVYMPLESSAPDPEGMTPLLSARRMEKREFLNSLMNPHSIKKYALPCRISTELRPYQQEGVNWLDFLNRYNLHGILCDDLGLGKTLQTICILAGDHHQKRRTGTEVIPSLVICPSTLTGHWQYEIKKFVPDENDIRPLLYAGSPDKRIELASKMDGYNLIIASYEIVRNDFHIFSVRQWNYCVLDEGHIIQNHKAKISRCIRQLKCTHRLILTGTPIQNQVNELWSLFDFLMPGFLGTEQQFNYRYHRPVAQSKDSKATPKDQEAGALALESLHRKVLPFMLRRMKEDVLSDLPPKIMQDYYCDLTPLQQRLYEMHTRDQTSGLDIDNLEDTFMDTNDHGKQLHIFQALQYLRKICNHPRLVIAKNHPFFNECKQILAAEKRSIKDLEFSGKLMALKQLLHDCGIGVCSDKVVSQHRILIFCQMRAVVDMVEELFKTSMSSVTYLRLDGTITASQRHDIVLRFNNDPSIDCLIMTTSVGGLGLNLTGADTVIFMEHDWNPMKDLQAMDRAHRIGQKKVVNVYRILTRDTLEEKIMGLQKFKLSIANTVITTDNSSLNSMGTNQLLDLFDDKSEVSKCSGTTKKQKRSHFKVMYERMETLFSENQYENEYSMSEFEKKLSSSSSYDNRRMTTCSENE